jgi:hypothetical protein
VKCMSGLNISFGLTASEDELAAWNRQANSKVAELVDANNCNQVCEP